MGGLLGPVLLLVVLVWTLGAALTGRAGWASTVRARRGVRRYERRPSTWAWGLAWIPTGFALATLVGDAPATLVIVVSVLVAAVHRAIPDALDIVVCGGGVAATMAELADGTTCRPPLGAAQAIVVVATTVGVVALSTAAGGLTPRSAGTAATSGFAIAELSLFALAPDGMFLLDLPVHGGITITLLSLLAVASTRTPALAHAALGAGLIAGNVLLAATASSCAAAARPALIGAACFAATRWILAKRSIRQRLLLR